MKPKLNIGRSIIAIVAGTLSLGIFSHQCVRGRLWIDIGWFGGSYQVSIGLCWEGGDFLAMVQGKKTTLERAAF